MENQLIKGHSDYIKLVLKYYGEEEPINPEEYYFI